MNIREVPKQDILDHIPIPVPILVHVHHILPVNRDMIITMDTTHQNIVKNLLHVQLQDHQSTYPMSQELFHLTLHVLQENQVMFDQNILVLLLKIFVLKVNRLLQ